MIPKIIHYCWFGHGEMSPLMKKCMASWGRYCPDYQIIEWNEDNVDIAAMPLYVRQAYEAKKWAFITDYVRLQVVYEHGGVYLDTDVELVRPLDSLLQHRAYFGFESGKSVATGLGFGAEQGCPVLAELMEDYREIPFVRNDGTFDVTPCPVRNTKILLQHGLKRNGSLQILADDILILPTEYLCPITFTDTEVRCTENTYSIHHFAGSWFSPRQKEAAELTKRYKKHLPEVLAGALGNFVAACRYEGFFGAVKLTRRALRK